MAHTPYGYRIENGKAVIDEAAAEKVKMLYEYYLEGRSLVNAAKDAGIETSHGTARRMMENRHYLGNDFYPAIINAETFSAAGAERERRMKALGRTDLCKAMTEFKVPMSFRFGEVKAYYDDPVKQAEYLYSLIESEER